MVKVVEMLQNSDLIDERQIWVAGQIRSAGAVASYALFGAIGGAISAAKNMRYLSIQGDDLIESKISKKVAYGTEKYNKQNVTSAVVKLIFFGLSKKLVLVLSNGKKVVYEISAKRSTLDQIADLFN